MATYLVDVPFTGYVTVKVDAATEDEAKDIAFSADFRLSLTSAAHVQLGEFETHEHITSGNVFHGVLNDICVEPA